MIEHSPVVSTPIELEINGRVFVCSPKQALEPLLDYIRAQPGLTGTKEGCGTGECGACMVLLESPTGWQAINSCLLSLGQTHGQRVVTIEGVGELVNSVLHPAQEAMITCRAAQCGFCTPGMVMTLASMSLASMSLASTTTSDCESGETVRKKADLQAALAGNLCRCTGYRPILDAAERFTSRLTTVRNSIPGKRFARKSRCHGELPRFFAPVTLDELLSLRNDYPEAVLLAGGTDLMIRWNESGTYPQTVISTRDVEALGELTRQPEQIRIGASVPLQRVFQILLEQYPELTEYLRRFASPAINTMATLAGNLQTASPVGDMIPLMVVLGASVTLASTTSLRSIPVADFYQNYRATDIRPTEVITAVLLPQRQPHQHIFAYKVAKRFDQDISTLTAVAALTIHDSVITKATICYGGMSATVHRARQTEKSLIGRPFDTTSVEVAGLTLEQDYSPISDLRGSSDYRRRVAANLLRKMLIDYGGTESTSAWQVSQR